MRAGQGLKQGTPGLQGTRLCEGPLLVQRQLQQPRRRRVLPPLIRQLAARKVGGARLPLPPQLLGALPGGGGGGPRWGLGVGLCGQAQPVPGFPKSVWD